MTALYITEKIIELSEDMSDMDLIFTVIGWVFLTLSAIALYVFLVTSVLPHFFLSPSGPKKKTGDRGIKKYVFPEGRGVAYEPELSFRRYMRKYLLFEYKGKKYAKFKFCEGINTAECEVALYNNKEKLIKIFSTFCDIDKNGDSEAVEVPDDTSFARVTIIAVNGVKISDGSAVEFSMTKWGIFAAATTTLTVILGHLVRTVLVVAAELLFSYSDYAENDGFGFAFWLSLVTGLLLSVIGARLYFNKKAFKVNKDEK